MRTVNLAKVAIEAEILRYKSMAARHGRRAAFAAVALIFGLGFLIALEIAAWQTIRVYILPVYATLCVMGFNLLLAAAFTMIALRSSPGQSEIDALEIRKKAVQALQTSMTISALVPTAGYLWRRGLASEARLGCGNAVQCLGGVVLAYSAGAAAQPAKPRLDLANIAASIYDGDVISDARGASRSNVRLTDAAGSTWR